MPPCATNTSMYTGRTRDRDSEEDGKDTPATESDGRCGQTGTRVGDDRSELRTLVVGLGFGTLVGVVFRRGHSKKG